MGFLIMGVIGYIVKLSEYFLPPFLRLKEVKQCEGCAAHLDGGKANKLFLFSPHPREQHSGRRRLSVRRVEIAKYRTADELERSRRSKTEMLSCSSVRATWIGTANRDTQQEGERRRRMRGHMLQSRPQNWLHRLEYRAQRGRALVRFGLPLRRCWHQKTECRNPRRGFREILVRYYNFFLCEYTCFFFSPLLVEHLCSSLPWNTSALVQCIRLLEARCHSVKGM
jgi:hypothetical protein